MQAPPQPLPQPRQPAAVPFEDALRAAAAAAAARKAAQQAEPHSTERATLEPVPVDPPAEQGHAAPHGGPTACLEPAAARDDQMLERAAADDAEHAGEPRAVGGDEMDALTAEGIAAAEVLVAAAREVRGCDAP